jgi:hypothetical protein
MRFIEDYIGVILIAGFLGLSIALYACAKHDTEKFNQMMRQCLSDNRPDYDCEQLLKCRGEHL